MRVGLVTTSWVGNRCGVAEYSRMLIENMNAPDIEMIPIYGPYEATSLLPKVLAGYYDIVHFNYDSGFLGIFAPGVATQFKRDGAKIVITLNDHHARNNRALFPFTSEFDKVIVHQETGDGFEFVRIGIDVMEPLTWDSNSTTIGTCGFPLPQKGILVLAEAAAILAAESGGKITGCNMVCPESQHIDTHAIGHQVKQYFPKTNYLTQWLPQKAVQDIMAMNRVNVFPMRDGKSGISSSVRMAVATGSPMVLSRSWMFEDWRDHEPYASEIEWIPGEANDVTARGIAEAVLRVMENGKRPKKILEDFTWKKAAQQYVDLYRSLVA